LASASGSYASMDSKLNWACPCSTPCLRPSLIPLAIPADTTSTNACLSSKDSPHFITARHSPRPIIHLRPAMAVSICGYSSFVSTEVMGDQGYTYTLDEAISTIGFGNFQLVVLAYAGFGWVAEAMEMMLLSFVGPAIQPDWGLSSSEESLISTVAFFGMLVGAYLRGVVSDSYGRKKGLLSAAIISTVAGLLSAFAPNYTSLLVLRCIVGVDLGGGHVSSSWFLEFIPISNRGLWMVGFTCLVGTIMEASLAWWIMPSYGWRWLLGLSAVPYLVALLFYGLVPESPRYLCTQGRLAEAQYILEKGAALNQKELPVGILISDMIKEVPKNDQLPEITQLPPLISNKTSDSQSKSPSIFMLLSPSLIRTTLLLWWLYFCNNFAYYGIILLTSQLSIGQSECDPPTLQSEFIKDPSLYVNVFITSLAASFTVACIYAPEVFPTNLRATGVGITTAVGKIRGMVCPLIAVGMGSGCHQTLPVILFEVTILLSGLSIILLPFETKGKELTDNIDLHAQHVLSPYTPLPPTTELPKKRVGRIKKNSRNDNISPLNLGNAFTHDNVGGDDVLITGVHDIGINFTYENVNPNKVIVS
nr:organic cation/carnitine transporter 7-like [Tanacetum cinerariifolium]